MNKRSIVPLLLNSIEEINLEHLIYEVESPFESGKALYKAQGISIEEIKRVTENSMEAFKVWKTTSFTEKRNVLDQVASLLDARRSYFMDILEEMGLPQWFAHVNVETGIQILKECAANVSMPLGTIPRSSHEDIYTAVVNEPIGPVLSIAPWNAPIILCIRAIAGPVAAGCSVVVKTSEHSPLVHMELAKLFTEAGAPSGLVNSINHRPQDASEVTKALIRSPHIKKVTFTGSSQVGQIISKIAAEVFKPVLLELGGKSAVIVTKSADIIRAADAILNAAFAHNGQICMSTERVYVENEVYDNFVDAISKCFDEFTSTQKKLPQRSSIQSKKIDSMVRNAIKNGAKMLCGRLFRDDAYIEPLVIADVSGKEDIYDNETFGPIFYINRVSDVSEAISKVNASRYGLSTAIWSSDVLQALEVARDLESGAVHINGKTIHDEATLPHGGVKESGFGRFNSTWGLQEFQYTKTITLAK
ncbi:uncharacterized protein AC631_05868 [Debaryomyces fabryi]|uniref:Aldehyde dehydrogenase domain-containing protein n=1 Tax=Debaryomyces fabryi TaxID=58627 RepID=A0A0V1PQ48_9ASCO|nr:uncharacterized protein AC631_05868 [Debaryomyces fabryi]KRZ98373.1 hypothetical protein AC631_05868 [Debaryomyces fabryi]CUM49451.1 unnamed protein product [Debaryomyces fabryi]